MSDQLETALMFAAMANDFGSLKALARAEDRRAEMLRQLLAAVLAVAGPIRVKEDLIRVSGDGFTMTKDGEYTIFRHQFPARLSIQR